MSKRSGARPGRGTRAQLGLSWPIANESAQNGACSSPLTHLRARSSAVRREKEKTRVPRGSAPAAARAGGVARAAVVVVALRGDERHARQRQPQHCQRKLRFEHRCKFNEAIDAVFDFSTLKVELTRTHTQNQKMLNLLREPKSKADERPPDVGYAWFIALASFLIHFVVLGTLYSFRFVPLVALLAGPCIRILNVSIHSIQCLFYRNPSRSRAVEFDRVVDFERKPSQSRSLSIARGRN